MTTHTSQAEQIERIIAAASSRGDAIESLHRHYAKLSHVEQGQFVLSLAAQMMVERAMRSRTTSAAAAMRESA